MSSTKRAKTTMDAWEQATNFGLINVCDSTSNKAYRRFRKQERKRRKQGRK